MIERRKGHTVYCVCAGDKKGSETRSTEGGFKLFYHGADRKRSGIGVHLREEYVNSVVELKCQTGSGV